MRNEINKFEQALKDALEGYEIPNESGSWDDLQQELDKVQPASTPKGNGRWYVAGAAAVIATVSVALWPKENQVADEAPQALVEQPSKQNLTEETQTITEKPFITESASSSEKDAIEMKSTEVELLESDQEPIELEENSSDVLNEPAKEDVLSIDYENQMEYPEQEVNMATVNGVPKVDFRFEFGTQVICESTVIQNVKEGVTLKSSSASIVFDGDNSFEIKASKGSHIIEAYDEAGNLLGSEELNFVGSPNAYFNIEKSFDQMHPETEFNLSQVEKGSEYRWNFGDGSYSFDESPSHLFKRKGSYDISLMVVDANGCTGTYSEVFRVENDYNLLAPTGFSPDNDGINDTWFPQALVSSNKEFTVEVLDVRGNLVFRSNRSDLHWDGQVPGAGVAKAHDIFQWRAIVKDDDNSIEVYSGSITVVGGN